MRLLVFAIAYVLVPLLAGTAVVRAGEIRVITSGGFTAAYQLLARDYETQTGDIVLTAYGASSGGAPDSIPERLKRGEPADLIILSRESLDALTAAGKVRPASRTDLVRSKIGMSVRMGAPKPDISTPAALIRTLRNARSIAYSASASGTYLSEELFPRLGIWDEIKSKTRRILSERVAAVVARGEVEIGFQQISEILPIPGADYAGAIPDELQEVTVFSAGVTTAAQNPDGAMRLIRFFSAPAAAPAIIGTGLEPVVQASAAP